MYLHPTKGVHVCVFELTFSTTSSYSINLNVYSKNEWILGTLRY